jgi:aminodeoxyfutalosine synthase
MRRPARIPFTGAEIFNERVRRIICDHKIDGAQWLEVARAAYQLGLKSNCTMLYGHIEDEADRVDYLVKLRALQDDTGGFQTFIPLPFHPANTALENVATTTGFLDLKMIAVARLMLDNIDHIKAHWIMLTPRMPRSRNALAPTTWTGQWWKKRSTTMPAPPPARACGAASCCG